MSTVSTRRTTRSTTDKLKTAVSGVTSRRGLRDITNTTAASAVIGGQSKIPRKVTRSMTKKPKTQPQSSRAEPENMEVSPTGTDAVISSMELEMQSPAQAAETSYVDIDKDDLRDADSEARYILEIHETLRARESHWAVDASYFRNQTQINERMREILVDWLVDVHLKFKCVTETLFLTVALLDRYLEIKPTEKNQLQLVGVTAFMIASKYEEMYPPEISDLVFITDRTYTRAQLLSMEQTFLATLQFNITMPSIEVFRVRFVKAALHGDEVLPGRNEQRQLNYLSAYYSQLCLQKIQFLKFLPSTIGAASVYLARKALGMAPEWHGTLSHYSKFEVAQILPCVRELSELAGLAVTSTEQRAVIKKFSHSRYLAVGTLSTPEI